MWTWNAVVKRVTPLFTHCDDSFVSFCFSCLYTLCLLILFHSIFFSVCLSYHVTYFLSCSVYFILLSFYFPRLPSFRPFLISFFPPQSFVSSFPSCHLLLLCLSSLISLLPSFISCIFRLSSPIPLLVSHFLHLCFPPCPDSKAALRSLTPVSLLIHILTHCTFLPPSGTIDHISNIPSRLALQGLLTVPNAAWTYHTVVHISNKTASDVQEGAQVIFHTFSYPDLHSPATFIPKIRSRAEPSDALCGVKVKVKFTLEQTTKAQMRSKGLCLLFL